MAKAKPKRKRAPARPAKFKQVYDEIENWMENMCDEAPAKLYDWVTETPPEKLSAALVALCKKQMRSRYTSGSINAQLENATLELARLTAIRDLIAS